MEGCPVPYCHHLYWEILVVNGSDSYYKFLPWDEKSSLSSTTLIADHEVLPSIMGPKSFCDWVSSLHCDDTDLLVWLHEIATTLLNLVTASDCLSLPCAVFRKFDDSFESNGFCGRESSDGRSSRMVRLLLWSTAQRPNFLRGVQKILSL